MSAIRSDEIISILKEEIKNYDVISRDQEVGTVISVGDGIASVYGIDHAMYGEIVTLETGLKGMVQDIKENEISCILFGDDSEIKQGTKVCRTGKKAGIPVGEGYIGRIVDALGAPIDGKGEIIYHPRQKLIYTDLCQENNIEAAGYEDGSTEEIFQGEKRLVTVKTVSYTGWKIVSVVPMSSFDMGMTGTKYFVIMLVTVSMLAVILLNQLVSASIAMPLKKLNNSVKEWETGNMNPSIYIGGSMEVEHLGCTLRSTVEQIRQLMQDIVVEQEEKRKSELDALQSQINPHFLYNTLDSIVWMIEGERYEDAVFMITQLASLFRISLSRGKTVISVEDELKHARNYMNIQKVRYKNIFEVRFDIDPEILQCCTVKLVVQPLLENAIYYGVECMDGDGEIDVNGYRREDDIYIEVRDNGLGIPEDEVEQLLKENNRVHKRGSGVGLLNVHNRIRLRFGEEYGLEIESEPDEGTTVRIHLPYIVYTPEEQERLESGRKQL